RRRRSPPVPAPAPVRHTVRPVAVAADPRAARRRRTADAARPTAARGRHPADRALDPRRRTPPRRRPGPRAVIRIVQAVIALAAVWLGPEAHGYPHWQFSTGNTRCSNCHLSPTGGGLLSDDGREQAGEQLSSFGGDGALLHGIGRAPGWLVLGGDLRGAFVA